MSRLTIEEYIKDKVGMYGLSTGINKKPCFGFGINDAVYITQSTYRSWYCPHFRAWQGTMQRGHSVKFKQHKPTYKDCSVDMRWKYFSEFLGWSLKGFVEGWELDKDLLVKDNKVYGPDTCAYVPTYLNNLIKPKTSKTGLPFGVSRQEERKGTFIITAAKGKAIGGFKTATEAHRAWQSIKAGQISLTLTRYAEEPEGFRTDVAEAINKKLWNLMLDYSLGKETYTL